MEAVGWLGGRGVGEWKGCVLEIGRGVEVVGGGGMGGITEYTYKYGGFSQVLKHIRKYRVYSQVQSIFINMEYIHKYGLYF